MTNILDLHSHYLLFTDPRIQEYDTRIQEYKTRIQGFAGNGDLEMGSVVSGIVIVRISPTYIYYLGSIWSILEALSLSQIKVPLPEHCQDNITTIGPFYAPHYI